MITVLLTSFASILALFIAWIHGHDEGVRAEEERQFEARLKAAEKAVDVDRSIQRAKEQRDVLLAAEIKRIAKEQREAAERKAVLESEAKAAIAKAEEQWNRMKQDAATATKGKSVDEDGKD